MSFQIEEKHLNRCFFTVNDVLDKYHLAVLASHATIKSVDVLVSMADQYTGKKVTVSFSRFDADKEPIKGYCIVTRSGDFQIGLLDGMNFCWRRFVLCKELFHAFLAAEELYTPNIEQHIDDFYPAMMGESVCNSLSGTSELLAEIAAMEFLFPYADRLNALERGFSPADLAERYKIPLVIVERHTASSYMTKLGEFLAAKQ